jgi:hypothetical protein
MILRFTATPHLSTSQPGVYVTSSLTQQDMEIPSSHLNSVGEHSTIWDEVAYTVFLFLSKPASLLRVFQSPSGVRKDLDRNVRSQASSSCKSNSSHVLLISLKEPVHLEELVADLCSIEELGP